MTRTFNFEIRKKDWCISIGMVALLAILMSMAHFYAKPLPVLFVVIIIWVLIRQMKKELKNAKT